VIQRLLVANRGEIAIRAFRAAVEQGMGTIAVYTREDRGGLHRSKADEAYEIGEPGRPVRAYLDVDELVATAVSVGADGVYPGYGFLSESPEFARRVAEAGLVWVGPPSQVLALTGDKISARDAAAAAGVPVLRASPLVDDPEEAVAAAEEIGLPVFVKAAAGGGGRGLRRVEAAADLRGAVETAIREASGAFGDPRVFLEQAVTRPRHIEVQLLGDAEGGVVHLFERDCSVQRRHQKVLEVAPAQGLDDDKRAAIHADAARFAEQVGYIGAGTAEFLVDGVTGEHVFIEMNPRIQVEHTVTEEVCDVDIVGTQLALANGASLADLGLFQQRLGVRGAAVQCRVTTEDPANGFRPDTGRITAYRSPGGHGVRLDAGSAYVGAAVSPYFDSMLTKLSARGPDIAAAATRARRALAEFRIRGVATNLAFLRALLAEPEVLTGRATTSFVDDHPELLQVSAGRDRASRLLEYLADVTVNQPHGPRPANVGDPVDKLPAPAAGEQPPAGSRQRLDADGPAAFARWLRQRDAIGVTDTTFRDAHQSLLATRMRTIDMVRAGPYYAHRLSGLLSLECWGGATYDVALRFLREDPWQRLERLRASIPNVCLQMLLRGANAVGYAHYPEEVVRTFVVEAAAAGIDIFRVFDALNDVEAMSPAIKAVGEAGKVAEGTLCYTGDLLAPDEDVYTLDHYLRVAEGVLAAGAHVLCIKDMAGLLRAPAAHRLVRALRQRFDAPVHLHTHDSGGGQLGTYHAAVEAGVDAIDGASAPLSGMTSQPNLAAIVAATDHTERASGVDLDALGDLEPYWERVRHLYAPFEAGLAAPTGTVYRHEIPGGQLSNLRQQATALGLADRFDEIEHAYARCDQLLGRPVKVTPTSKVVGDLALYVISAGIDLDALAADPGRYDLPASVLDFLRGELGTPPGGWPEPFRSNALVGRAEPQGVVTLSDEDRRGLLTAPRATLNRLLFPGPTADYEEAVSAYGDLSVLPTRAFWYGLADDDELAVDLEPGVRLYIGLEAVGEPDDQGVCTVLATLNGQPRPIDARDRSVGDAAVFRKEQADRAQAGHVAAPLTGVVAIAVREGQQVAAGDEIATIEAMKMESSVSAPIAGRVARIAVPTGTNVEPGDLLLAVEA